MMYCELRDNPNVQLEGTFVFFLKNFRRKVSTFWCLKCKSYRRSYVPNYLRKSVWNSTSDRFCIKSFYGHVSDFDNDIIIHKY